MLSSTSPYLTQREVFVSLFLIGISILLVFERSAFLPTPNRIDTPLQEFSEERARIYLKEIIELGSQRTVGSEANEVLAPKLILQVVSRIENECRAKIEKEIQQGDGSFWLDFLESFTSVYSGVKNVLVMLHGEKPPSAGVLMISAHYDSPVGTVGAADNAANVANLLEILQVMACQKEKIPRSVLFMFTGAEETILQGSHMFSMSGHRWVNLVQGFINIEAAGSGGRELMFQATSNSIARAWAKASPYPHGSIVGQDVFQSGIIPSDTDFRMYVDRLKIPGMDMANVESGHNYHTSLDVEDNIQPGAMQRYGENVLETAMEVLRDEDFWRNELSKTNAQELLVFFDVLGMFVVVLSGFWMNVLILLGAGIVGFFFRAVFFSKIGTEIDNSVARSSAAYSIMRMFLRTMVYPLITGIIVHSFTPLVYYSRPWFVYPLYFSPSLYGVITALTPPISRFGNKDDEQKKLESQIGRKEILLFSYGIAFWTFLSTILVLKGKGSFYLSFSWAVFPSLFRMIRAFENKNPLSIEPREQLILLEKRQVAWFGSIIGSIIPFILTFPLLLVVLRFFIPITGRSGSMVPGDVIVAVICGLCTFLLCLVPSSALLLLSPNITNSLRKFFYVTWISSIFLSIVYGFIYGSGNASFSSTHPKRIYAIHVDTAPLSKEKASSFVWIIDADSSSINAVFDHVKATDSSLELDRLQQIDCDERYETAIYCDLPWFLPLKNVIPKSNILPVETREIDDSVCLMTLLQDENIKDGQRRLHFRFKSGERANLYFNVEHKVGPIAWSFDSKILPVRGALYVLIANGIVNEKGTEFWIDVPVGKKLDMAWACYQMDDKGPATLQKFVKALPDWTSPISFTAVWRSGQF